MSYVLIVDLFALALAFVGFSMAFRQASVRRMLGHPPRPRSRAIQSDPRDDPLTYVLRIAGIMLMIFGVVIGGMVTLIYYLRDTSTCC